VEPLIATDKPNSSNAAPSGAVTFWLSVSVPAQPPAGLVKTYVAPEIAADGLPIKSHHRRIAVDRHGVEGFR
jgi:hypothetical protein